MGITKEKTKSVIKLLDSPPQVRKQAVASGSEGKLVSGLACPNSRSSSGNVAQ